MILSALASAAERPNIILIFADNLGNGDLGCFGSTLHRTPNIDRLATEGARFTSFYVASGVCTPSRAALMTGCYPLRISMHAGSASQVLRPVDSKGLHPDETTVAECLKAAGYATGLFGKWHLGDQPIFLPTRQGFDEFFGIPYSDDMTKDKRPDPWPELPLLRGEKVIEAPVDRNFLVKRCTGEVIGFIERNAARPFFACMPQTMPGSTATPFSSPAFRGKSKNGEYGDSVEELDWSVGQILAALERLGLSGNTLIIWTSDNGAVRRDPPQGSCAPYRGWGYDTSEGAMRMPCVMRWPGKIPAGRVCDEICTTMDLLPTFAAIADAPPPPRPIDGHDVRPLLFGAPGAKSPWDEDGFCYYRQDQLQAVRAGEWKLYLGSADILPASKNNPPPEKRNIKSKRKASPEKLALYDVRHDVHEDREVSAQNPEIVRRLTALAERTHASLARGQRPAGHVDQPKPLLP